MRAMPKKAVPTTEFNEVDVLIEDAAHLTPKELEQERKAKLEELKKRTWMSHSAEQLASRIPVSVFAIADVVVAT